MNNTLIGKTFLRLGLVSFGGPTAHIGYFRDEFVKEKKWLLEDDFSSLLAICQALPGPTSSQMVFSIGLKKGGFLTAYIALIAFSFPSVFLMILLGLGYSLNLLFLSQSTITAVSAVAIPVVGMAVFSMFRNFCSCNFEKIYFFVLTILLTFFDLFYYPAIILIASWLAGASFYKKSDMKIKTQPLIENINKYLVYG
ncbi:chromate transporter, partial [Paracoccaceae bacterium]|nr:chromate transporter [Paracoccaceae bacterium]